MRRRILSLLGRLLVTAGAFLWIFRTVDLSSLQKIVPTLQSSWLLSAAALYFLIQGGCIARWRLLVPQHPALTGRFLARSFFIACFFNTFLPTTVGGDVVRGYDLIKATGEWRGSLASILLDRLTGFAGMGILAFCAWLAFPPARQDPVLMKGFFGFCLVVGVTFAVLGSRRVLNASLKPFSKIGLGALSSHAQQFQETLLAYLKTPQKVWGAVGLSLFVQAGAVLVYWCIGRSLRMDIPLLFFVLTVPIIFLISQLPISLSGWGIREGATIVFFGRIGMGAAYALSLSLLYAMLPLLTGAIGGLLFLTRRKRR